MRSLFWLTICICFSPYSARGQMACLGGPGEPGAERSRKQRRIKKRNHKGRYTLLSHVHSDPPLPTKSHLLTGSQLYHPCNSTARTYLLTASQLYHSIIQSTSKALLRAHEDLGGIQIETKTQSL